MDFTREPIIETVITPREGFKLAIRNSKGVSQEEFFVDAIEIVSFGGSFFYRSLDRPKSFMVPVSDYEVLEVRETRMVLKHVGVDRSIKIGGGKARAKESQDKESDLEEGAAVPVEPRSKRERRRSLRRRRDKEKKPREKTPATPPPSEDGDEVEEEILEMERPVLDTEKAERPKLLEPPPTLIAESMGRYRSNEDFRGAFIEEGQEPQDEGVSDAADERFLARELDADHDTEAHELVEPVDADVTIEKDSTV